MSPKAQTKWAPAPPAPAFACPGGCGRELPLERGFLVTDAELGAAAILCETCTTALVLERGRTERRL